MDSVRPLLGVRYAADAVGGAGRGHVESYFLKANDPRSARAIWIKTTIYASARGARRDGDGPPVVAEAWAVAFDRARGHVAVKSIIPYARARFDARELDVEVDGVVLRPNETRGAIESGGRIVSWDLSLLSDGIPIVHFPHPWMYEAKLPSTKIVSPFPDVRASGTVTVNGERWDVSRWPGLLQHNWGPRHTPLYAWGHCNLWKREPDGEPARSADRSTPDGEPARSADRSTPGPEADGDPEIVFEGVSARVKVGPVLSPLTTLLCLRWRGVRYDLNTALDLVTNTGELSPRRWTFAGENRYLALRGEMWAETDDFVGLFYENPDGPPTYCLNSKLAHARLEIEARGRAPFSVRSEGAALEIGTLNPTHGVRMYL